MARSWRFFAGGSIVLGSIALVSVLIACGKSSGGFGDGDDGNSSGGGDDGGFNGFSGSSGGGSGGTFTSGSSGSSGDNANANCKGGHYTGSFGGLYSSHITLFGINIPVTGDVQLNLKQKGSGEEMCTFEGESTKCSDVFSLENGTIDGVADMSFPYHCDMTGTLGCAEKKLVDGWIECTYCLGPIADGGEACVNGNGVGSTPDTNYGTGGKFAGPLTADYFYKGLDGGGPPSFGSLPPPDGTDPGQWNGAEALARYPGTGPLPDGGTLGMYLSDAGYGRVGVMNDFGGNGWWYAVYTP